MTKDPEPRGKYPFRVSRTMDQSVITIHRAIYIALALFKPFKSTTCCRTANWNGKALSSRTERQGEKEEGKEKEEEEEEEKEEEKEDMGMREGKKPLGFCSSYSRFQPVKCSKLSPACNKLTSCTRSPQIEPISPSRALPFHFPPTRFNSQQTYIRDATFQYNYSLTVSNAMCQDPNPRSRPRNATDHHDQLKRKALRQEYVSDTQRGMEEEFYGGGDKFGDCERI
ncbi:hypothetical protein EAI_13113 [Harpegnathos saltator]|uniref:Uncharacterized protein n=1 Tax=Harpegnathos saltator TaxID=610380 RepID=E2BSZ3_HARSA|nr:hypothetical protein EAI_13113 [Harpegnathos saltator]